MISDRLPLRYFSNSESCLDYTRTHNMNAVVTNVWSKILSAKKSFISYCKRNQVWNKTEFSGESNMFWNIRELALFRQSAINC